jgi:hypothetical protein
MSDPIFAMWGVLLCIAYLFTGPQFFARKPASFVMLIIGTLILTWLLAGAVAALRALTGWSL